MSGDISDVLIKRALEDRRKALDRVAELEARLADLRDAVLLLPRLPDANVPIGSDPWEACRNAVLGILEDIP